MKKLRVALLIGGPSAEHEVSLASGRVVFRELDKGKYDVIPVLITKNGEWSLSPEELREKADVAFVAMHGEYGEDGTVQSFLKSIGVPFTGSDALSSALAMNKILSSRLFSAHGLSVPRFRAVHRHSKHLPDFDFDYPYVVKPADRGSSVGVSIVRRPSELHRALERAFYFSRDALVQEYIPGREVTCAVLDDGAGDAFPLPPTEIIPRLGGMFDYHAKYTPGATEEITPARFDNDTLLAVQEAALVAHRAVGASGMSRTDMIIGEDGILYTFEVNTIPGITETSLLPQAAIVHGLTLAELFDRIIEAGLRRHRSRLTTNDSLLTTN